MHRLLLAAVAALVVILSVACPRSGPPPVPDDAGAVVDAGPPPEPDTAPPLVAFTGPEEDCLSGRVTFAFTVSDESTIGLLGASFAGTNLAFEGDEATGFTASRDVSSLLPGFHALSVYAIDVYNNETEATRSFGVPNGERISDDAGIACGPEPDAGPEDTTPPVLTMQEPGAGSVFANALLRVSVEVSGESDDVTVIAQIGTATVALSRSGNHYSGELDTSGLAEGQALLVVTATDDADNSAELSRDVVIDHTPPSIDIVLPLPDEERVAESDVIADVTDENGVGIVLLFEEGVDAPIGSATTPVSDDRYGMLFVLQCTTPLPRDTTLRVTAADPAGNVGSDSVNVRLLAVPACDP